MRSRFLMPACCFLLLAPAAEGRDNPYYTTHDILLGTNVQNPRDPDWKPRDELALEVTGMAVLDGDRLAVAIRKGDIWFLDGASGDPDEITWSRFASGLDEPLGLLRRGDTLLVTQRSELTELGDRDGDGVADRYRTVAKGWHVSGNYHGYAYGPAVDKDGHLWVTTNLDIGDGSRNEAPWRGWGLRISPDGTAEAVCAGMRSPCGLGANAAGDVFFTDQQGNWIPTNSLHHLRPGAYYGNPEGIAPASLPGSRLKPLAAKVDGDLYPAALAKLPQLVPPAVWFPYNKMGRSRTGITLDTTGGRFGPFDGQLFVGEFTSCKVGRVFLEKINGEYQGACFPFLDGFPCAVMQTAFGRDGSMFVGMTNRGWSSLGSAAFGLQRVVWNGTVPFEAKEMRARPDGFELVFTNPVDPATAADPDSYTMTSYTYRLAGKYGGEEEDPKQLGITRATVSADGLTVHLAVDGLRRFYVHELHYPGVRSRHGGKPWHHRAYYTLNHIPNRAAPKHDAPTGLVPVEPRQQPAPTELVPVERRQQDAPTELVPVERRHPPAPTELVPVERRQQPAPTGFVPVERRQQPAPTGLVPVEPRQQDAPTAPPQPAPTGLVPVERRKPIAARPPGDPPPPNVLLIISDDQAWRDFGFMGNERVHTPNLDRLAESSLFYPNGYVPTSVCSPSLATLLTGLYPHQHHIHYNHPPPGNAAFNRMQSREEYERVRSTSFARIRQLQTLPRILGKAGYRSLQTGKFWEGPFRNAGFTEGMTIFQPVPGQTFGGNRTLASGELAAHGNGDFGLRIGRETMAPIDEFIGRDDPRPWFIWYAPYLPHEPHDSPRRFRELYKNTPGIAPHQLPYYASIAHFDETVGHLLELLESRDLLQRTLIVFVTDNGWSPGPDGRQTKRSKRSPFEDGLRTPVLFRWDGQVKPAKRNTLVSTVSVFPTVAAACGIPLPRPLPGRNLLAADLAARPVFGEIYPGDASALGHPESDIAYRWVRHRHLKLITTHRRAGQPPWGGYLREDALFDLAADPGETRNLLGTPGRRAEGLQLRRLLDDWWTPSAMRTP